MAETNTKPSYIPIPFANGGQKNTIPVADQGNYLASWTLGFPTVTSTPISEGGLPPDRLDVNGALNVLSAFIYYLQCGGVFTYDANLASAIGGYANGMILAYIDSTNGLTFLRSTKNNNQDNFITNPSYIGTSWVKDVPTMSDLTNRVPASVGSSTKPVYTNDNGVITACTGVMGVPNYANMVSFTSGTTASSNGWLKVRHLEYKSAWVKAGTVTIYNHVWGGGDYGTQYQCSYIPIAKDDVITYGEMTDVYFVPCK